MNRRHFLKGLLGAAAALAVAPLVQLQEQFGPKVITIGWQQLEWQDAWAERYIAPAAKALMDKIDAATFDAVMRANAIDAEYVDVSGDVDTAVLEYSNGQQMVLRGSRVFLRQPAHKHWLTEVR